MGLGLTPVASRFLGGRPGLLGGPAVLGFFLEKRTEVRRPTSEARAQEDTLSSTQERRGTHRVQDRKSTRLNSSH